MADDASQVLTPFPPVEIEMGNPLPVGEVGEISVKPSASKGRKFNPVKPPAIRGYKWSPNGAGFDCRKFAEKNGKVVESFVAYLGKKKLSEFRSLSENREELRELVRNWILEKESEKGK